MITGFLDIVPGDMSISAKMSLVDSPSKCALLADAFIATAKVGDTFSYVKGFNLNTRTCRYQTGDNIIGAKWHTYCAKSGDDEVIHDKLQKSRVVKYNDARAVYEKIADPMARDGGGSGQWIDERF